MNLYISIIIGCTFGLLIDAIVIAPLDRDMWFRNSIYDESIYTQINVYKNTDKYRLYKFKRELKEK